MPHHVHYFVGAEPFVPLESEMAETGETLASADQLDLDWALGRLSSDDRLCIVLKLWRRPDSR